MRAWAPAAALTAALIMAGGAAASTAAAATAYTVEPLNLNVVESTAALFGGALCEVYDCERVPTAASLDLSHRYGVFGEDGPISAGAATLNDRLVADNGEKLVFGFSQGAQIAGFWLRNYAATSAVDPQETSFLLVGDPENTYGVPWAPRVPTDSGFAVTELWSQYDGWADWPARFSLLAAANAVAGMFLVHPTVYDELDLEAERSAGNLVTWQNGTMTYTMVGNDRLPLLTPLRWVGLGAVADALDAPLRDQIEASYDRPTPQQQVEDQQSAAVTPEPAASLAAEPGVVRARPSVRGADQTTSRSRSQSASSRPTGSQRRAVSSSRAGEGRVQPARTSRPHPTA
ncbi:MAG: PE-PPE domain-containing protein [Mycobacterium sp.]|nr:PE-PPE domain-containing protein [Mycobacterium sp.]